MSMLRLIGCRNKRVLFLEKLGIGVSPPATPLHEAGASSSTTATGAGAINASRYYAGGIIATVENTSNTDGAFSGVHLIAANAATAKQSLALLAVCKNSGLAPDFLLVQRTDTDTMTARLGVTADGRLYGTALHNNSGSLTGTENQYIASGKGTATVNAVANCDSVSDGTMRWVRVGNTVSGSLECGVDPTAATTLTEITINLPIASAFTLTTDANGGGAAGVLGTAAHAPLYVSADNTNDRLAVAFYSLSGVAHSLSLSFSYEVKS